ncbi:MAG: glycosyltransferase [Bdellovibrionales bacterium]|nr:glycosyltransferase [Bdellovibrionales bacterium]
MNWKRLKRVLQYHGLGGIFYRAWRRCVMRAGEPTAARIEELKSKLPSSPESYSNTFFFQPRISIVLPVCDPPLDFLQKAIQSVVAQVYSNWELCVVDDASSNPEIYQELVRWSNIDQRIRVKFRSDRGHIARASQDALNMATGEYVALLDHDDILPHHALYSVVQYLQGSKRPEILYSDEATINEAGVCTGYFEKPKWSPMYFRSFMYVGHLTVYERCLLEEVGGFREGFDGSQDYDMLLRAAAKASLICHIPEVLYYWRAHSGSVAQQIEAKEYAFENALRALQEQVDSEIGVGKIVVSHGPYPGTYRYRQVTGSVYWLSASELRLEKLQNNSSPYIGIVSPAVTPPEDAALLELIAPLAFSSVGVVAPLLVSKKNRRRVVSAGRSRHGQSFRDNLAGFSTFEGGPGHRLYVAAEVEGLCEDCLVLTRELLVQFLECGFQGEPLFASQLCEFVHSAGKSCVVVPSVRVRVASDSVESSFVRH